MNQWKHIVVGDVVAGSLRAAFDENQKNEYVGEVRRFRDDLSVGRIDRLMETFEDRIDWFSKITAGTEFGEYLKDRLETYIREDYEEILAFQPEDSVVIWHSGIVSEQVTLRYLAARLYGRELWEVDLSKLRIHNRNGRVVIPRALGACTPSELMEAIQSLGPIPRERLDRYRAEWRALSEGISVLRIWDGQQVVAVDASYYDQALLDATNDQFRSAAEVVGEVMAAADQIISDTFLDYRLRQLIQAQSLEHRGSFSALGTYEVRRYML